MPYILLGIGILFIGLAIMITDKKAENQASDVVNNNQSERYGSFMDELNESVQAAEEHIDARIAELGKLQETIDNSLQYWQEAIKKAQIVDKEQRLPQKHKEVLTLKRNGLNISEIAKRMNIGKGEVELILALYEAGEVH